MICCMATPAAAAGGSFSSLKAGGGGIGGHIKLGRSRALYRYPTDELSRLYRQLLATGRCGWLAGLQEQLHEWRSCLQQLAGGLCLDCKPAIMRSLLHFTLCCARPQAASPAVLQAETAGGGGEG